MVAEGSDIAFPNDMLSSLYDPVTQGWRLPMTSLINKELIKDLSSTAI
jgi:hypothetical protein